MYWVAKPSALYFSTHYASCNNQSSTSVYIVLQSGFVIGVRLENIAAVVQKRHTVHVVKEKWVKSVQRTKSYPQNVLQVRAVH